MAVVEEKAGKNRSLVPERLYIGAWEDHRM